LIQLHIFQYRNCFGETTILSAAITGRVDHLGQRCKAEDIKATVFPTFAGEADGESISPSQEAATLEALNAFGVEHLYVNKEAAGWEKKGLGRSYSLEGAK
jgi:hypothetical protein